MSHKRVINLQIKLAAMSKKNKFVFEQKALAISMAKRAFLLFFTFFAFARVLVFGQISANPTNGCAPLVGVAFTGVPGASNILWTFGDGTTSSLANPVHTFALPQTYT